MNDDFISKRLYELRKQKGTSARDMSLTIGQNVNYINNIENGKALPSMSAFYYICEYLNITPVEFFDAENSDPLELRKSIQNFKKLDPKSRAFIDELVQDLLKKPR